MKNKIVVILILVEVCSLFLMYKSSQNKPVELDDVIYNENITKYIFMLEESSNSKNYIETSVEGWPSEEYHYNTLESRCYDKKGTLVEDALTYDDENNFLVVNKDNLAECDLYFDKKNY